jgi:hypothetical protein
MLFPGLLIDLGGALQAEHPFKQVMSLEVPQYFAQTYFPNQIQNKSHVQKKNRIWVYKGTCLHWQERQIQQWDRSISGKQKKSKYHQLYRLMQSFYTVSS